MMSEMGTTAIAPTASRADTAPKSDTNVQVK